MDVGHAMIMTIHLLWPGFVCFSEAEDAEEAFVSVNGTEVDGKTLKIDFAGRRIPVSRLIVKNLPTVRIGGGKEIWG